MFFVWLSLFAAVQEQLGLRLEGHFGPVDIWMVDGAEQSPAANERGPLVLLLQRLHGFALHVEQAAAFRQLMEAVRRVHKEADARVA